MLIRKKFKQETELTKIECNLTTLDNVLFIFALSIPVYDVICNTTSLCFR